LVTPSVIVVNDQRVELPMSAQISLGHKPDIE
jgi:hypothetical protein